MKNRDYKGKERRDRKRRGDQERSNPEGYCRKFVSEQDSTLEDQKFVATIEQTRRTGANLKQIEPAMQQWSDG